ncbi:hypothetical protein ACF08N_37575 [Streptomyces sp. NPDC015127]|uniref:hypothetical protein n=1 Tax=Streptomyces sp. NPDC015127 TaxID=3364939 RepID=UPI0036FA55A4
MCEAHTGAGAKAVRARWETIRAIDVLCQRLARLREELQMCPDEVVEVRAVQQACAMGTSFWLDDLACALADTGMDADGLFDAAWQLVDSLPLSPGGFESREDPRFFDVLRAATAKTLGRLWITGYLLGPVPTHAWPNADLARLLLRAIEQHADDLALGDDLRQAGLDTPAGPPASPQ